MHPNLRRPAGLLVLGVAVVGMLVAAAVRVRQHRSSSGSNTDRRLGCDRLRAVCRTGSRAAQPGEPAWCSLCAGAVHAAADGR